MHSDLLLSSCQTENIIPAASEDFADLIIRNQFLAGVLAQAYFQFEPQPVDAQYSILHFPVPIWKQELEKLNYFNIPKLFTEIDTVSLEASGIRQVQIQPSLMLKGSGVLMGFLDSGIDYTHPAFRSAGGTSRIVRIWDQTDLSGPAPEGIPYGTEYTQDQINQALFSDNPREIVPVDDPTGHGTAVCGVACGSQDIGEEFIGAAPDSQIVFVKLRRAKQYLRDYFLIPESSVAYQETDLMLGIRYLVDISLKLRLPLVICISLGTNQGGHTGNTPLEDVLTAAQYSAGIYAVTGTGNEAGKGHHFLGRHSRAGDFTDIELLVDEATRGFTIEFWADVPELYSVGFTSPLGETVQPIQPRSNTNLELNFVLENSKIFLTYFLVELLTGSQLIQMRFQDPSPGVWRLRIVSQIFNNSQFHLWLPITGLVEPSIRFYGPNPDTTLVIPSCAETVMTCSTYDAYSNSLFANSGRGLTRNNLQKPDLAAPGVNVTAPAPGNRYIPFTGSCCASALTAGAVALFIEAGLRSNSSPRYFSSREIKSLFERGANRSSLYTYPNREWGYGTLDVYGIFEYFLRT